MTRPTSPAGRTGDPVNGAEASRGDPECGQDPSTVGYRWVCPVCGETGVHPLSGRGRNALRALKTHVYFSTGDGHGNVESYPRDHPGERLADSVGRARAGVAPE